MQEEGTLQWIAYDSKVLFDDIKFKLWNSQFRPRKVIAKFPQKFKIVCLLLPRAGFSRRRVSQRRVFNNTQRAQLVRRI
jgi:hypothetical protein